MSLGSGKMWLVGFGKPPTFFLILVPLLAVAIIQHKKTNSLKRSILLLATLLFCAFGYLKLSSRSANDVKSIECNGGNVTLAQINKKTTLIDPGVIGRRLSAPSWVEYTLAPTIIQTTGSNRIDNLVLLQPSIMTFKAAEKLCNLMPIGTIYLPYWDGTLSKNGWRNFFFLKRAAENSGTNFVRIGSKTQKITLSQRDAITIEPLEQQISYHDAHYPSMRVCGQIDNKSFTIYSAKYKKKILDQANVAYSVEKGD
ncbi:hypothetical protein ACFLX2_00445 [Candidatus Dependentiae bacterium]